MDQPNLADNPVFVSHEWITANLDAVTLIDVRSPDEYREAHIRGAVNIPFRRFRDDGDADIGKLPGADAFASLMGKHGIIPDDTLVAYDDGYGVYASRFLVTALVYGHSNVHVAGGDFTAWRADRPVIETVPARNAAFYPARRVADAPVLDSEAFAAVVDSDALIIDTRVEYEYQVAHIPGARQLNWRRFVNDDTRRVKPTGEIRRVLADREITPDRRVVLYCNTARRLSFTYGVLKHVGYDDVAFYEGGLPSWAEAGGAIETGT